MCGTPVLSSTANTGKKARYTSASACLYGCHTPYSKGTCCKPAGDVVVPKQTGVHHPQQGVVHLLVHDHG